MSDIVTGSAGFIGSHITEKLLEQGKDVYGIDNFHPYYSTEIKKNNLERIRKIEEKSSGKFRFINGSILDQRDLKKLPVKPTNVFHNAAIAGVRNSINNPSEYAKHNLYGTSKILDYFDDLDKFIFASSSSVYGMVDEDKLPVNESRDLDPIAPYPQTKKQCEEIIKLYSELYGFDYTILRYFTAYGPRQRPDEVFTKFTRMVLNKQPVSIYGDGRLSRDFTYVKDIVRANMLAAEKADCQTYNIGTGRRITVNKIVNVLDKVMHEDVEKKYVDQLEGDVRHTHADISKAKKDLGYEPEMEFEQGVKECVEWVREIKNKGLF